MKSRRKFTKEFKMTAVRRLEGGQSPAEVARALEVHPSDLYRWRNELQEHGNRAFSGKGKKRAEESRVAELEQKVGQQAMEIFPDEQIAATLNRLRLRTGADNAWNQNRVYSVRHYHQLPAFDPNQRNLDEVTLKEAAQRLDLSPLSVRHMIEHNILPAQQVVECAPWQIPVAALESETVRREALKIRNRIRVPRTQSCDDQQSMFSDS